MFISHLSQQEVEGKVVAVLQAGQVASLDTFQDTWRHFQTFLWCQNGFFLFRTLVVISSSFVLRWMRGCFPHINQVAFAPKPKKRLSTAKRKRKFNSTYSKDDVVEYYRHQYSRMFLFRLSLEHFCFLFLPAHIQLATQYGHSNWTQCCDDTVFSHSNLDVVFLLSHLSWGDM